VFKNRGHFKEPEEIEEGRRVKPRRAKKKRYLKIEVLGTTREKNESTWDGFQRFLRERRPWQSLWSGLVTSGAEKRRKPERRRWNARALLVGAYETLKGVSANGSLVKGSPVLECSRRGAGAGSAGEKVSWPKKTS